MYWPEETRKLIPSSAGEVIMSSLIGVSALLSSFTMAIVAIALVIAVVPSALKSWNLVGMVEPILKLLRLPVVRFGLIGCRNWCPAARLYSTFMAPTPLATVKLGSLPLYDSATAWPAPLGGKAAVLNVAV